MKRRVRFDFACNNPDNGLFAGKVNSIHYALTPSEYIEIDCRTWDGYAFTVGDDWIRLHRRKFKVVGGKDWIGNWCWNAYAMERTEAKRFLAMLKSSGNWHCVQGPTRWHDWFNGRESSDGGGSDAPRTGDGPATASLHPLFGEIADGMTPAGHEATRHHPGPCVAGDRVRKDAGEAPGPSEANPNIEIISQRSMQIGGVKITTTFGRLK